MRKHLFFLFLLLTGVVYGQRTLLPIGTGKIAGTTFDPTRKGSQVTLSNGNLTLNGLSSGGNGACVLTSGLKSSGKWYALFQVNTMGSATGIADIGILLSTYTTDLNSGQYVGSLATGWGYHTQGASVYKTHSGLLGYGTATTFTSGDYIAVALDLDNGAVYFGKVVSGSMVWQNGGDPTSGASKTNAAFTGLTGSFYVAADIWGGTPAGSITYMQTPPYAPPTGYTTL